MLFKENVTNQEEEPQVRPGRRRTTALARVSGCQEPNPVDWSQAVMLVSCDNGSLQVSTEVR